MILYVPAPPGPLVVVCDMSAFAARLNEVALCWDIGIPDDDYDHDDANGDDVSRFTSKECEARFALLRR